ncbi:electron carrier [Purpureocillium takamizusanense]|uniref:Electron carrier n=1 Tax=Purpureocillium takamizusanense TaxID=2060973 RepID=A0A9Q8QR43_9HYPO|nr:electron carrier [Purpureocillium takamizusanense]UNI23877.1 electron carrier [Purpureocillium takamizusanense]
MAPVIIDTSDDLDLRPAAAMTKSAARTLLLAPPSVAAHEERLRDALAGLDRARTDIQMLDRLAARLVALPSAAYDQVLVLADPESVPLQQLGRDVYALLVPAMRSGGALRFQSGRPGARDAKEAILAGLVERDGGAAFDKVDEEETVVPLRLGKKKTNGAAQPPQKNGLTVDENAVKFDLGSLNDLDDDDEIIDENGLLTEEDLKRRPVQPENCNPQKRRRPCKDCTCGLAAKFEAEDKQRRADADAGLGALKLDANDLNELDFTVKGKTGSCNNCSLGDAFRCSTCPYVGLPAFKPGEEVRLLNDVAQL